MPSNPSKKTDTRIQQQAPPPEAPPEPYRVKSLREVLPEYAAGYDKLAELRARQGACQAERDGLLADLGQYGATNDTEIAALELLGEAQPGAAAEVVAKHARLKTVTAELAALTRAVAIQEKNVGDKGLVAGRRVMGDAATELRRLMVEHAAAVVNAAKSRTAVLEFQGQLDNALPPGMSGSGNYTYAALADTRDHCSSLAVWLAEQVDRGFLDGNEPFLQGVALVCRKPDGSVIDRPTPLHPAITAWATPPDDAPKPPGLLSVVGAAVQRGVNAVAGLVAGRTAPADDALPPAAPSTLQTGRPPVDPHAGPTRRIELLRDMATSADLYRAGTKMQWEAGDAARMVERGIARWAGDALLPSTSVAEAAAAGVAPAD